jgi:pentose-5-phosphate-3-epimerase
MYEFKQSVFKKCRNFNNLTEEQRLLWEERVAICMIDGGVDQERAEEIAWQEIEQYDIGHEQCDRT